MNLQFTIKTIYSCHYLDYRDTILALKASGVSNSTMSGATCSKFQSRTVLGKNDIFLVSIQEDGIWNDLLCACLVFRPCGISLFSLLMATSSLSILYSITSLASFLLSASGLHFSLCMMLPTLDLFVIVCYISSRSSLHCLHLVYMYISLCIWVPDCTSIFYQWTCKSEICLFFYPDWWDFQVSMQEAKSFICFAGNRIYVLVPL